MKGHEGTLSLVTKFTDSYLAHSTIELENNSGSESDKNTDSDASSESESEEVPFEIRSEDKIMDDEVNRFRDGGCGCHLDDGKI